MLPGILVSLPGLRAFGCAAVRSSYSLREVLVPHSRLMSLRARTQSHSCTVDPRLTEEFVFVDCLPPKKEPDLDKPSPDEAQAPSVRLTPPHRKRRGLERQLQTLKTIIKQDQHQERDLLQFHDSLTPGLDLPQTEPALDETQPDPALCFSSLPCSGCGALLQAVDPVVPGFVPLHLFKTLPNQTSSDQAQSSPERTLCQRCHSLTYHQQILEVTLNHEHFREMISSGLRSTRALVVLVVDLVDLPDSIIPDLHKLIGPNKQVAVVGTKLDLLPVFTSSDLSSLKKRVRDYTQTLTQSNPSNPVSVNLVSAKTGFGIEELISGLQKFWRHKGNVVLVGSANAGKSTLFNALLESDYSRSPSGDYRRATVSPWPGTTLNLLKFPILNPTPVRLLKRQQRLKQQAETEVSPEEDKRLRELSKQGYVIGRVGRTFKTSSKPEEIQFDPDLLAFGETEDGLMTKPVPDKVREELSPNELKDAHWLYDTPGIIKEQDILKLLTEDEVLSVVPVQALVPRTFVLKPGSSLFVGGLVRIDFTQGCKSCWFSVLVSGLVPVHISSVERADSVYEKHAGDRLLGVPMGGAERMKTFPKLVPMEFQFEGKSYTEAVADIKISSAGWVAVTPPPGDVIHLKVWAPEDGGVTVRTPPLLPGVVNLKGARIRKSAAYKSHKPQGKLLSSISKSGTGNKKNRK